MQKLNKIIKKIEETKEDNINIFLFRQIMIDILILLEDTQKFLEITEKAMYKLDSIEMDKNGCIDKNKALRILNNIKFYCDTFRI